MPSWRSSVCPALPQIIKIRILPIFRNYKTTHIINYQNICLWVSSQNVLQKHFLKFSSRTIYGSGWKALSFYQWECCLFFVIHSILGSVFFHQCCQSIWQCGGDCLPSSLGPVWEAPVQPLRQAHIPALHR